MESLLGLLRDDGKERRRRDDVKAEKSADGDGGGDGVRGTAWERELSLEEKFLGETRAAFRRGVTPWPTS